MTIQSQMEFWKERDAAPFSSIPGLTYLPDFINGRVEANLINTIDTQPWITELKRRVQHYGYRYDYKARAVTPESYLGALPDWLSQYADSLCADGIFPAPPDQAIVNEYQPGQGIAPHIDCIPCFTDTIASLSLGSSCVMEFTHVETQEKTPVLLEPRSLIILSGDARYHWRHGIASRKSDRHNGQVYPRSRRLSLTFRKMVEPE